MPAGRQGISKAGRSTQGKVRGLRSGASFPEDIMAARRDRVARASKALGKGSTMEITFSRNTDYSLDLSKVDIRRELAAYLDIDLRTLTRLVDKEQLFDEHGDSLISWMETKSDAWEITGEDDIEIDQILS